MSRRKQSNPKPLKSKCGCVLRQSMYLVLSFVGFICTVNIDVCAVAAASYNIVVVAVVVDSRKTQGYAHRTCVLFSRLH